MKAMWRVAGATALAVLCMAMPFPGEASTGVSVAPFKDQSFKFRSRALFRSTAFQDSIHQVPAALSTAFQDVIPPAIAACQVAVGTLSPAMAEIGTNLRIEFSKATDKVRSAAAAFQAAPMGEFVHRLHDRGVVGVSGLADRISALFDKQFVKDGSREALTLVGSTPDEAVPGYSKRSWAAEGLVPHDIQAANLELTNSVLNAFKMGGWEEYANKNGVTVWRRDSSDMKLGEFPEGVGPKGSVGKFLCVKAAGTIDAPVEEVYRLFLTCDYVKQYNSLCQECLDLGFLDRSTKISWSSSKRMGPILPRDFVTRCHYRKLRDGSLVMATMSEQLPCDAQRAGGRSSSYYRMDITLAGYLLRPTAGGAATELSMISLANPGGVLDSGFGAKLSNWACATGPVDFMKSLRRILDEEKAPSPQVQPRFAMA